MKEYLLTDVVTYNLMSFTAFKSILIFAALLDGPKTYEEIRDIFLVHKHLHEKISIDTLRVYINSLERMGCKIVKSKKSEGSKYQLLKHPFELQLNDKQVNSIIKIFKIILKTITVEELYSLTKFFQKISQGIENNELKENLINLSPLNKIDNKVLEVLIEACNKKDEITFMYNSINSNSKKQIRLLSEELFIKNNNIYLQGESQNVDNKVQFLVSRIDDIPVTCIERTIQPKDYITIGCEIYNNDIKLNKNEKLISQNENTRIIEITSDNIFRAKQRILELCPDCKVLYPEAVKKDIYSTLKKMREEYNA